MVLYTFFYTLVKSNPYAVKRPIRFLLFFVSISSLAQHIQWQKSLGGEREEHLYDAISTYAVSYTHLTLPTIYSV